MKILLILLIIPAQLIAQNDTANLPNIIINIYGKQLKLKESPGPINYINKTDLERGGSTSILTALNSTPGIKMEERSPGSYRLNIRGSSLRSPFGVRNVKVYYNDIPFTDPGGQTYLNQLGFYNFNSITIIKGANNSIYGAGNGGVILIENSDRVKHFGFHYTTGSYDLQNIHAEGIFGRYFLNKISYQHQSNDGYRDHSRLRRDVFTWNGEHYWKSNSIKTTFLFGDLYYQTPGALTLSEYLSNPKASRPPVGTVPGAEQANASIRQTMILAGLTFSQEIFNNVSSVTTLYGMFTQLKNPAISNYAKNSEPHFGGRTLIKYDPQIKNAKLHFVFGAEIQQGFASVAIYKNVGGNRDSLRSNDEINNRQQMFFAQTSIETGSWNIDLGASLNSLRVGFERFSPASSGLQVKKFNNQIAPRFSIMKKFGTFNLYGAISKGFSPPTTAELFPTGGAVNFSLNPETGFNYDIGIKTVFKNIYLDINAFALKLSNAIVQRRDALGSDYYINSGGTRQWGLESYLSSPIIFKRGWIKKINIFLSDTYYDFHYRNFVQLNNDYSNNLLPSVAKNTFAAGVDIISGNGIYLNTNYYLSGKIPLNDANTAFANAYELISVKVGYQSAFNKLIAKIEFGVDNLLNEKYSLGNDINGFGGRYYNAAPLRNYFVALHLEIPDKAMSR